VKTLAPETARRNRRVGEAILENPQSSRENQVQYYGTVSARPPSAQLGPDKRTAVLLVSVQLSTSVLYNTVHLQRCLRTRRRAELPIESNRIAITHSRSLIERIMGLALESRQRR
jgi:hypothetical protein